MSSRTRQSPNEQTLYLFKLDTTDTNNHIENTWNATPQSFKAEFIGERTRNERDVLSGRVLQSGTVEVWKTTDQLDYTIGDNVSEKPNANEFQQATIVNIKSKPLNKRGARHNTTRIKEYTLELS